MQPTTGQPTTGQPTPGTGAAAHPMRKVKAAQISADAFLAKLPMFSELTPAEIARKALPAVPTRMVPSRERSLGTGQISRAKWGNFGRGTMHRRSGAREWGEMTSQGRTVRTGLRSQVIACGRIPA